MDELKEFFKKGAEDRAKKDLEALEELEKPTKSKEVKIKGERYQKTSIVTATAPGFYDTNTEETLSTEDLLLLILNKLDKIERSIT